MTLYFRCPGCHRRMTAAPQLLADRAHYRAGTKYAGMVAPAEDMRAFPCERCETPIERGKLVRGHYDEKTPLWVAPAAAALAVALGYLAGWILDWGVEPGIVAGGLALATGWVLLYRLHHDLVENGKLSRLKLKTTPFVLGAAVVMIGGTVAALVLGTWLYRQFGWLAAAGGLIAIFIAVMAVVQSMGQPRRKRISYAEIAEENQRQAGPR